MTKGGHQHGRGPIDLLSGEFAQLTPSSFGRIAIMEATEQDVIILDNPWPIMVVSANAFEQFVHALDAEARPNPRLEALFADRDLWAIDNEL